MPPRYVYWTILIDNKPTAFRAREQAELLPTFNQLRRTNPDIALKWFAHGRLWDSPEQADWARRNTLVPREKRGPDWRPGGRHEDPKARYARKKPRSPDRGSPDASAARRSSEGSRPPRSTGRRPSRPSKPRR